MVEDCFFGAFAEKPQRHKPQQYTIAERKEDVKKLSQNCDGTLGPIHFLDENGWCSIALFPEIEGQTISRKVWKL